MPQTVGAPPGEGVMHRGARREFHWQPVLSRYSRALTRCRRLVVIGVPDVSGGGRSGATIAHGSSVQSVSLVVLFRDVSGGTESGWYGIGGIHAMVVGESDRVRECHPQTAASTQVQELALTE